MRFKKAIRSACLLLAFIAGPAYAGADEDAVIFSLKYCFDPLSKNLDVATAAKIEVLAEFNLPNTTAEQMEGGRKTFAISENVILLAEQLPLCSMMIKKLDKVAFWKATEKWFGEKSPFRIHKKETANGAVSQTYLGKLNNVEYTLVVSARDQYQEEAVQGLITFGRSGGAE